MKNTTKSIALFALLPAVVLFSDVQGADKVVGEKDPVSKEIEKALVSAHDARKDRGPAVDLVWYSGNDDSRPLPDPTKEALEKALSVRKGALAGEPDALYHCALGYLNLSRKDEYWDCLNRACEKGNIKAIKWLADEVASGHLEGTDHEKMEQTPFALYLKAANLGDTEAKERVAQLYEEGRGDSRDKDRLINLLEDASNSGSYSASLELARIYIIGVSICGSEMFEFPKSPEKAEKYLETAISQGSSEAEFILADLLLTGKSGFKVDKARASNLLLSAAPKGEKEAQYLLAFQYFEGSQILGKDYVESYYWFNVFIRGKAESSQKSSKALSMLSMLETLMTKDGIAEAQKRSKDYFSQKQKKKPIVDYDEMSMDEAVEAIAILGPKKATEFIFRKK